MVAWLMNDVKLRNDADASVAKDMREANYWMPMRLLNGIHLCIDRSPAKQILSRVLVAVVDRQLRPNFKVHSGTQTEVLYNLMSYGIPTQDFPVKSNGDVSIKNQVKWIARRQARDQFLESYTASTFKKVELPSSNDVILVGRRMLYHRHAGNQNLRLLLESMLPQQPQDKKSRAELAKRVLEHIQAGRGRFLRKDKDDWWMEVPEQEARDKVLRSFATLQKTAAATETSVPLTVASQGSATSTVNTMTPEERSAKKLRRQSDGLTLSDNASIGGRLDCFGAPMVF